MPNQILNFLQFMLLVKVFDTLTQFWLFSRQDGYTLLANLFRQPNLQTDALNWLKFWGKVEPFGPPFGG